MSDQEKKSPAEKFYEAAIDWDSSKTMNDLHSELERLNENVEKSNTYLKYLVWFLVYLPIIVGIIYLFIWVADK